MNANKGLKPSKGPAKKKSKRGSEKSDDEEELEDATSAEDDRGDSSPAHKPTQQPSSLGKRVRPEPAANGAGVLKRPAASHCAKPPPTKTPIAYNGCKIYYSEPKHAFRVYVRKEDRVEKFVSQLDWKKPALMKRRWADALKLIDDDCRPRTA